MVTTRSRAVKTAGAARCKKISKMPKKPKPRKETQKPKQTPTLTPTPPPSKSADKKEPDIVESQKHKEEGILKSRQHAEKDTAPQEGQTKKVKFEDDHHQNPEDDKRGEAGTCRRPKEDRT